MTSVKFVAVLAAALALPGIAAAADTVRFGTDTFISGSQVWIAKDKGFFDKHGIDAQLANFATGVESLDSVLTGRTDLGIALDFPTTLRMQSGQLKIVSAVFASLPGFHKLVVADAIKAPGDLKGKRIGIAKGTAQNLITVKYLEKYGIAPADVTLVSFQTLIEMVAALKAGRIDASFLWADGVTKATESGGARILTDDREAGLNQSGYLAASKRFAEANPKAVENTLLALAEATDFIKTHTAEAAKLVAARNKAPVDAVERLLIQQAFTVGLTQENADAFGVIAAFASDVIKTPVSFDTAVDLKYLRAALPQTVTVKP
jgi:NitT/TauT family transport system substrate-binding protein